MSSQVDASDNPSHKLLHFEQISCDSVLKVIKASLCKTCTLDPWPSLLTMEFMDVLIGTITKLINNSLSQGVFPSIFKNAIITPLLKKPQLSPNEFRNYRPVSNLPYISKLIERIVALQLKEHISNHELDNPLQSAYKANHSTETALLKIQNDIHDNLARGRVTALILLDLSAAFDTIDHGLLFERLQSLFGIQGVALNWLISYLTDRSQSVKVGDSMSTKHLLKYGVPQGSVLGPLLFTMYTTPLGRLFAKYPLVSHHIYADDTQVYIGLSNNDTSVALDQLSSCLESVKSWMESNLLKLNPDKTEFMLFGSVMQRNKIITLLPETIMGELITPSSSAKNLGVTFHSEMSLSNHVSSVCKSCFYHIRDLRRIRRFVSKRTLTTFANALVTSRLDYCNSLFSSLTKKELGRLQRVQNTLCRVVTRSSRYSSVTPQLKSLHWLPVSFRVLFKTLLLTYKTLGNGAPKYLSDLLHPYASARSTRMSDPDSKLLATPFFDKKIHRSKSHLEKTYAFYAPRQWNALPLDIRNAPSVATFKKRLKTLLFDKAFFDVP